jgi:hypothetical protein
VREAPQGDALLPQQPGGDMERIGTDKTDNFGRFEIIAPLTAGEYQAAVSRKAIGDLVCRFAISAAVRF